jgi:signal transduction histidine kinase/DNA-binding response OmpR family regulator
MFNDQILLIFSIKQFDSSLWTLDWLDVGALISLILAALIFYKFRISKMSDRYSELSRQLNEKIELLTHANENEQRARERASLTKKTKSDLLTRLNREIRTPMNGVIGMASLLAETFLTKEQREYNETIRGCSENLLAVINNILLDDVLSDSKAEISAVELGQKDFDLRDCIEELLDVFANKTNGMAMELLYRMDQNVPSHIIGDSRRFRQVLMNLLENSVRFTQKGEILIAVKRLKVQDENTVELGFEVSDTGAGIADDKLRSLFKNLGDVNSTSGNVRGSGLGLVLCKKIVASMGGNLTVKSQVDKGTVISFTILAQTSHQSVHTSNKLDIQKGKQILIVKGNLTSGDLLAEQLTQWKLIPTVARSGKEALNFLAQSQHFDLIISDRETIEINGEELSQSIQRFYSQVPIILLSAPGDTRPTGPFDSILTMPIKQHALYERLVSGLRKTDNTLSSDEEPVKIISSAFSQKYPMRILVAEDNRINQKLAMKILGKLGYDPDIAQDGKEVLEMVSNKKYDLILMDIQMPEMGGLEATRMIRLCLETQPVVIAMTANSMLGDKEECLQAGMDDYISKPVHLEELVILLEKWALNVKVK